MVGVMFYVTVKGTTTVVPEWGGRKQRWDAVEISQDLCGGALCTGGRMYIRGAHCPSWSNHWENNMRCR